MYINIDNYPIAQRYHLITQTIIPRPIAWVLTNSAEDSTSPQEQQLNIAPFSFFTPVSSEPPVLMLSIGKKQNGAYKDTLANVLHNKKLVVHIANENQTKLVEQSATPLPHGESELSLLNAESPQLTTVPFEDFDLPRLAQCDIAYACELLDTHQLANCQQTLLFAQIKQVYINDQLVEFDQQGRMTVYAEKVAPLARLGANEYTGISSVINIKQLK